MSKSVVVDNTSRLSCSGLESPSVVLCLNSDELLTSGRTTIQATLTNSYRVCNDSCGTAIWRYIASYDNSLLVDPTSALLSSDVTGIFCMGCLTTWIEEEIAAAIAAIP